MTITVRVLLVKNLPVLSRRQKERLIANGFRQVFEIVQRWDSEELFYALGRNHRSMRGLIETALRETGYEIETKYVLKKRRRLDA